MATKEQTSSGIITFTGKIIDPINPDPEDIDIRDIAHSLSQQCRFTGHTSEFYSVAEHSVLVSEAVPARDAALGLMHDATEAYLADLAKPIKQNSGLGEIYNEVEQNLWRAIADHFDLPYEIPASVKKADVVLLATEARDLMTNFFTSDDPRAQSLVIPDVVPLSQIIVPWNPRQAHGEFMIRFIELF